jgi:hypothetical protein
MFALRVQVRRRRAGPVELLDALDERVRLLERLSEFRRGIELFVHDVTLTL